MRKMILTTTAVVMLTALAGSTAQAAPISPKTCTPSPCVVRTWHGTPWHRTWHGTPWVPSTRR